MLFPLLENAVESNRTGASVTIKLTEQDQTNILTVINEPEEAPGGEETYTLGYSSKDGHDGAGLTSVKNLLNAHDGATVSHEYNKPYAILKISLPGRRS